MKLETLLLILALALEGSISGQSPEKFSQRATLGYAGPVRQVLTTVESENRDLRPSEQRKLYFELSSDWVQFNAAGDRIAMSTSAAPDGVKEVSTRTLEADGTEVWIDSHGHRSESRTTQLADGSTKLSVWAGNRLVSYEVSRHDDKGRVVSVLSYAADGKLTAQQSTIFDNDGETDTVKMYDADERETMHEKTRQPKDGSRFDRWQYDAAGQPVSHIAMSGEAELLTTWYRVGYESKVSSSDSLGICVPRLCVSYKFDDKGSGRLERTVQHTPIEGSLTPDSEEHYDLDGALDEKTQFTYVRDSFGNWIKRSVFVWDSGTNQVVEVERDTREIEYYGTSGT